MRQLTYAAPLSNTRADAATSPDAVIICVFPSENASACKHPPPCKAVAAAVTCAGHLHEGATSMWVW
jgi:hypothetical protein